MNARISLVRGKNLWSSLAWTLYNRLRNFMGKVLVVGFKTTKTMKIYPTKNTHCTVIANIKD